MNMKVRSNISKNIGMYVVMCTIVSLCSGAVIYVICTQKQTSATYNKMRTQSSDSSTSLESPANSIPYYTIITDAREQPLVGIPNDPNVCGRQHLELKTMDENQRGGNCDLESFEPSLMDIKSENIGQSNLADDVRDPKHPEKVNLEPTIQVKREYSIHESNYDPIQRAESVQVPNKVTITERISDVPENTALNPSNDLLTMFQDMNLTKTDSKNPSGSQTGTSNHVSQNMNLEAIWDVFTGISNNHEEFTSAGDQKICQKNLAGVKTGAKIESPRNDQRSEVYDGVNMILRPISASGHISPTLTAHVEDPETGIQNPILEGELLKCAVHQTREPIIEEDDTDLEGYRVENRSEDLERGANETVSPNSSEIVCQLVVPRKLVDISQPKEQKPHKNNRLISPTDPRAEIMKTNQNIPLISEKSALPQTLTRIATTCDTESLHDNLLTLPMVISVNCSEVYDGSTENIESQRRENLYDDPQKIRNQAHWNLARSSLPGKPSSNLEPMSDYDSDILVSTHQFENDPKNSSGRSEYAICSNRGSYPLDSKVGEISRYARSDGKPVNEAVILEGHDGVEVGAHKSLSVDVDTQIPVDSGNINSNIVSNSHFEEFDEISLSLTLADIHHEVRADRIQVSAETTDIHENPGNIEDGPNNHVQGCKLYRFNGDVSIFDHETQTDTNICRNTSDVDLCGALAGHVLGSNGSKDESATRIQMTENQIYKNQKREMAVDNPSKFVSANQGAPYTNGFINDAEKRDTSTLNPQSDYSTFGNQLIPNDVYEEMMCPGLTMVGNERHRIFVRVTETEDTETRGSSLSAMTHHVEDENSEHEKTNELKSSNDIQEGHTQPYASSVGEIQFFENHYTPNPDFAQSALKDIHEYDKSPQITMFRDPDNVSPGIMVFENKNSCGEAQKREIPPNETDLIRTCQDPHPDQETLPILTPSDDEGVETTNKNLLDHTWRSVSGLNQKNRNLTGVDREPMVPNNRTNLEDPSCTLGGDITSDIGIGTTNFCQNVQSFSASKELVNAGTDMNLTIRFHGRSGPETEQNLLTNTLRFDRPGELDNDKELHSHGSNGLEIGQSSVIKTPGFERPGESNKAKEIYFHFHDGPEIEQNGWIEDQTAPPRGAVGVLVSNALEKSSGFDRQGGSNREEEDRPAASIPAHSVNIKKPLEIIQDKAAFQAKITKPGKPVTPYEKERENRACIRELEQLDMITARVMGEPVYGVSEKAKHDRNHKGCDENSHTLSRCNCGHNHDSDVGETDYDIDPITDPSDDSDISMGGFIEYDTNRDDSDETLHPSSIRLIKSDYNQIPTGHPDGSANEPDEFMAAVGGNVEPDHYFLNTSENILLIVSRDRKHESDPSKLVNIGMETKGSGISELVVDEKVEPDLFGYFDENSQGESMYSHRNEAEPKNIDKIEEARAYDQSFHSNSIFESLRPEVSFIEGNTDRWVDSDVTIPQSRKSASVRNPEAFEMKEFERTDELARNNCYCKTFKAHDVEAMYDARESKPRSSEKTSIDTADIHAGGSSSAVNSKNDYPEERTTASDSVPVASTSGDTYPSYKHNSNNFYPTIIDTSRCLNLIPQNIDSVLQNHSENDEPVYSAWTVPIPDLNRDPRSFPSTRVCSVHTDTSDFVTLGPFNEQNMITDNAFGGHDGASFDYCSECAEKNQSCRRQEHSLSEIIEMDSPVNPNRPQSFMEWLGDLSDEIFMYVFAGAPI